MPIPTEPVGSLPRSSSKCLNAGYERKLIRVSELQQAFADCDAGGITYAELVKFQDDAVKGSIKRSESIGQDFISDGEQRLSSFATYPITE
jgi:methionine synthase II (cobalamin-independent)